MQRLFCSALALLLLAVGAAGQEKELYVKSKLAKMLKNPRNKDLGVNLDKGTKVMQIFYKNEWYQVKYEGRKGWIYRGRIAKKAPQEDESLVAGGYDPDKAAKLSANSAARGLDDLTEAMAQKCQPQEIHKKFADYHNSYVPIDKIPSNLQITTTKKIKMVQITNAEIQKFMDEARDKSGKEDKSITYEEDDEGW